MAVITVSGYKTYAGISGTALDSQLTVLVAGAHARARAHCGRSKSDGFEATTRSEDYTVIDSPTIALREFPVASVQSIKPLYADGTVGTALGTATYSLDGESGVVTLNGATYGRFPVDEFGEMQGKPWTWQPGFSGRYRVAYTTDTVPDNLTWSMYRLVDAMRGSVGVDPSVQSDSLGSRSISYFAPGERGQELVDLFQPFVYSEGVV